MKLLLLMYMRLLLIQISQHLYLYEFLKYYAIKFGIFVGKIVMGTSNLDFNPFSL